MKPRCIRYGAPFRGPRRRLSFGFRLSEPATVTLMIRRRLNSSPLRRCPARRVPGAPGKFGPPIVVPSAAGAGPGELPFGDEGQGYSTRKKKPSWVRVLLRRKLNAGPRRVVLRQSPTALAPGTYVAYLTAKTADGRTADAGHVKFWVLTRARKRPR